MHFWTPVKSLFETFHLAKLERDVDSTGRQAEPNYSFKSFTAAFCVWIRYGPLVNVVPILVDPMHPYSSPNVHWDASQVSIFWRN